MVALPQSDTHDPTHAQRVVHRRRKRAPFPRSRAEGEGDQLAAAAGHPDDGERQLLAAVVAAARSQEDLVAARLEPSVVAGN